MSNLGTRRVDSLDERFKNGTTGSANLRWLCLTLAAAPILLATTVDVGWAVFANSYRSSLMTPWVKPVSPMRPLVDYVEPGGWGDVRKSARLPYFDSWLGPLASPERRLTTDELGLPNHPAGEGGPKLKAFDVLVTGASFTALADDIDHHMAAELAKASGQRVYNASWTGHGPSLGILWLLEKEQRLRAGQTIVWAIVQRQLLPVSFRDVWRRLSAEGEWKPPSTLENALSMARRIRYWPRQLEMRSIANSVVRRAAGRMAFALPVSLDRGATSSVQAARLLAPQPVPMLFFEDEIAAGYRDYESADGAKLAEAIERVALACERRKVRLLVTLIPDKFTFYAHNIEPALYPRAFGSREPDLPEVPFLSSMSRALNARSIDTIDLTPILRAHRRSNPDESVLYRRDDSHWSDAAIAIAAKSLAKHLRIHSNAVPPEP